MDGFAVARACRAEASLQSTRLVAVSGYSSPQDHAGAQAAGFECLLTKPVTRESLALLAGRGRRASVREEHRAVDHPWTGLIRFLFPPWGCSAAGSAREWHSRGHGFDPRQLHQLRQQLSKTPHPLNC